MCIILPSLSYSEVQGLTEEKHQVLLDFGLDPSQNSTDKTFHFKFVNTVTNQTVNNVSFFITITKQDKILGKDLFYTHTGISIIHFKNDGKGNWTISALQDPVLGGWTLPNDAITIHSSVFTKVGLYYIPIELLAVDYANELVDQSHPPIFDSWWYVDRDGNMSIFDISKPFWMKNTYHWWSVGLISDNEITNEIQYLMDKNIIKKHIGISEYSNKIQFLVPVPNEFG